MSISVNGQSVVPPGFRFHPTEEELLTYYLNKKVASERIDLDVIRDVDLNKLEPWDIQERCRIGTGPQSDWYFFSHKDKKYPTGTRTNRATAAGFWKATGRDKAIYSSSTSARIGMRKTLVFYKGRAPHGHKSDWIMHEYRLHDPSSSGAGAGASSSPIRGVDQSAVQEEGWVICRVFKKKNLVHQTGAVAAAGHTAQPANNKMLLAAGATESSPSNCSTVTTVAGGDHATKAQATVQQMMHYSSAASDDALDHILQYMGRSSGSCKQEITATRKQPTSAAAAALVDHHHHLILANTAATTTGGACPPNAASALYGKFMKLPPLEHVVTGGCGLLPAAADYGGACTVDASAGSIADWDTLDRLAAYELNGLTDGAASRNSIMAGFFDDHINAGAFSSSSVPGDGDLWSLAQSVSSLHADLTMNN